MPFKLPLKKKKKNLHLKGSPAVAQSVSLQVVTMPNGRKVVARIANKYDVAKVRERAARHRTFLRRRASELTSEALETCQRV